MDQSKECTKDEENNKTGELTRGTIERARNEGWHGLVSTGLSFLQKGVYIPCTWSTGRCRSTVGRLAWQLQARHGVDNEACDPCIHRLHASSSFLFLESRKHAPATRARTAWIADATPPFVGRREETLMEGSCLPCLPGGCRMDRTKLPSKGVDDRWPTRRRTWRCRRCASARASLRIRAAGDVCDEEEHASARGHRSRKVERASSCTWAVEHCASKPEKWDDKPTVLSWPRLVKRCVEEEPRT